MKKKFSAIISLAAEMGSSVNTVFGGAKKEIQSIGKHIEEVNKKQREIHKANKSAVKVSSLEKQLKEEMGSLVRTRKAIDQKTGATKKQAAAEKRQQAAIDRTRQALSRQREELKKVERGLQSAGVDTRHLSRELDQLGSSAARSGLRIEHLHRRVARMDRLRAFGRGAGRYMGGLWGGLGASARNFRSLMPRPMTSLLLGGGLMGLGTLGAKSFLNAGIEEENFATQMATLEKQDPAKVPGLIKWVKDFSWHSPYGVDKVSEAFSTLSLANIDPAKGDFMRSIGDAAASQNKGIEEVAKAVQNAMTGKFEMLKSYGITTTRNAKDGTVTFRAIDLATGKAHHATTGLKNEKGMQAILSGIFKRNFGGSMQKKSETLEGLIAGVFELWKNFQKEVMSLGVTGRLKGHLSGLLDSIKALWDNGTITRWAQITADRVGEAIDFMVAKGQELFAWTKEKWDAGEIQKFFGEIKKTSGEILSFGKAAWGVIEPLGGVKAIMVGMAAINLAPLFAALGPGGWLLAGLGGLVAHLHKKNPEAKEWVDDFINSPLKTVKEFKNGVGALVFGHDSVGRSLARQEAEKAAFKKWAGEKITATKSWFGWDRQTPTAGLLSNSPMRAMQQRRAYQMDHEGISIPGMRGAGRSVNNSNNNNNNRYNITVHAAPGREMEAADALKTRLGLQQPALVSGSLRD